MEQHEFYILEKLHLPNLPGLNPVQSLVVEYTWLVMAVLIIMIVLVVKNLKTVPGGFQNAIESLTLFVENYLTDIIGPKGLAYFPLVVTVMLFVLFGSYLGLIPGMLSPTGYIGTTAAMALIVFVFYEYVGISKGGLKYLKHFLGPVPAMAPFMLPMEIISEFARPFSLSVRLFANIFGGEKIIALLFGIFAGGLPVVWMLWDSIITIPIQGFIFSLLTMVYLAGAVASEEGH
jgi:F-type H+-transporting ATPase subunit a